MRFFLLFMIFHDLGAYIWVFGTFPPSVHPYGPSACLYASDNSSCLIRPRICITTTGCNVMVGVYTYCNTRAKLKSKMRGLPNIYCLDKLSVSDSDPDGSGFFRRSVSGSGLEKPGSGSVRVLL